MRPMTSFLIGAGRSSAPATTSAKTPPIATYHPPMNAECSALFMGMVAFATPAEASAWYVSPGAFTVVTVAPPRRRCSDGATRAASVAEKAARARMARRSGDIELEAGRGSEVESEIFTES